MNSVKTLRKLGILFGCTALLFASSIAAAQRITMRPSPSFTLLLRADVKKELNVTDAQAKQIDRIIDPLLTEGPNGGKGIRISQDTDIDKYQADVMKVLNAEQKKRLGEVQLWVQGGRALLRPEIADKLNLTSKQKEQIDAIEDEYQQEIMAQAQSGGRIMIKPEMAKPYSDRMIRVLTDSQKKTWDAMRGKPFNPAPPKSR